MLSRIRSNLSYANIAATLALVFAMSGGAYAVGKFLITSTKQISPKVLKTLAGKPGKPGANGLNGTNGINGKDGAPGLAGEKGAPGEPGKEGKEGKAGPPGEPGTEGPEGKEGSPWTAGGTLPSGKTETGTYGFGQQAEGKSSFVPITFTIPLKAGLGGTEVNYVKESDPSPPAACKGTSENPTAAPGNLCVYEGAAGLTEGKFFVILTPSNQPGASRAGAELFFGPEESTSTISGHGTWAVTEL
jgi:hypothetical protein